MKAPMKIEYFLTKLADLLKGPKTLHCQVLTYRPFVGREGGPVALESPGLSIHISSGPGQSVETMRSIAFNCDVEPADREAHRHLDEAWSRMPAFSQEVSLLFVAYAGAHAFYETLAYLEVVRRNHPSATVVQPFHFGCAKKKKFDKQKQEIFCTKHS